jgi:hypothetical protein
MSLAVRQPHTKGSELPPEPPLSLSPPLPDEEEEFSFTERTPDPDRGYKSPGYTFPRFDARSRALFGTDFAEPNDTTVPEGPEISKLSICRWADGLNNETTIDFSLLAFTGILVSFEELPTINVGAATVSAGANPMQKARNRGATIGRFIGTSKIRMHE